MCLSSKNENMLKKKKDIHSSKRNLLGTHRMGWWFLHYPPKPKPGGNACDVAGQVGKGVGVGKGIARFTNITWLVLGSAVWDGRKTGYMWQVLRAEAEVQGSQVQSQRMFRIARARV